VGSGSHNAEKARQKGKRPKWITTSTLDTESSHAFGSMRSESYCTHHTRASGIRIEKWKVGGALLCQRAGRVEYETMTKSDKPSTPRRSGPPQLTCVAWMALLTACSAGLCFPFQNSAQAIEAREMQLFKQAQDMASGGRIQDAVRIYEEIVQLDPNSFEALNNLGVIYSHMGDYKRAAGAYEHALAVRPGSFPVLMNLGIVYFKAGDFKRAAEPLTQAVALEPSSFQALALLGLTEYSAKDFAGACGHLAKAVAAQPGNSTLEYMLAESYLRTGQEQSVLDRFQKETTGAATSATDHMLLGTAYDGLGHVGQAMEELKSAATISPDGLDVHFGLGYLYWKQHDDTRAAAEFEREMEAAGWVAESEAYLGDIGLRQDRWEAGRAMLEQALTLNPGIRLAHLDLGILDMRKKDYGAAAAEFQKAIQLDPARADAYERLARVYAAEGNAKMEQRELAIAGKLRSLPQDEVAREAARIPPP
jgi:tetratricopeptide (TPR) repeat protein